MSQTQTARRVAILNRLDDAAGAAAGAFVTRVGMEPVPVADALIGDDVTFVERLDGVRGADYAIVLLPAAQLAAGAGDAGVRAETLLEVGFLFGVLGRRRVCFLAGGKAKLAPELEGIVLVHALDDANLWHLLLAREMRKAGLDVDMNLVA